MENYVDLLKDNNLKATFQRMTILSVIESMGHATIDDIYETVLKSHPTLSLATVYKNIITMVEKGVLVEVPISGKKSKYELKKHEHIHLICTECGDVIDKNLDDTIIEDTKEIAKNSSFKLKGQQVNLYGICQKCQKREIAS